MKTVPSQSGSKWHRWFPLILLVAVLGALFWRSFLPEFVHFSNDGPLGQLNTAWFALPQAFKEAWDDLNDIGSNAGTFPLNINGLIRWSLGSIYYAKFLPPLALLILGLGAYAFFKQLAFTPVARMLGALAVMLNSVFFSTACWGVASQQIAIGMDFCALALVVSNSAATPALVRWARLALAGACVGFNVMEAADIGAIFSVFVAGFVFWKSLFESAAFSPKGVLCGIGRVGLIAIFAGFIAWQTVGTLVTTQIQGVAGMSQGGESPAEHWDWATQWSLPKTETLGLFIPGVFGYKMDTPNNMPESLQGIYANGEYWGGMGRSPVIDRFFDSGQPGSPPSNPGLTMRFTGGQNYAGILVTLVAVWTLLQAFRQKEKSIFSSPLRQHIWFWAFVMGAGLLFAWGRFAPFYRLFYDLPYASTIRNPTKFIILYSWAVSILFAYGVHALSSRYLLVSQPAPLSWSRQLKTWWNRNAGFDRFWAWFALIFLGLSALGWLVYNSEKPQLIQYLQKVGMGSEDHASQIAAFSISQVGWYVILCALAVTLFVLVLAGIFSGKRAKIGGILLGTLLVIDLVSADLPFVTHWDYKQKYATNPVIDLLKDKPWEHRVDLLPFEFPPEFQLLGALHGSEWNQHHFPYYNIQTTGLIQRPRVASDIEMYEFVHLEGGVARRFSPLRFWQLTNTRYLLGPAGYLEGLNTQLDPEHQRFSIAQRFEIVPKPGIENARKYEELTAVLDPNGKYAVFDFAGALPRAKLYSTWEANTNDPANLQKLADKNFDPFLTVLVSTPSPSFATTATNQNSGTVAYDSYNTKDIKLTAKTETPAILLLNDKYDSNWKVTVDGKPSELLRCNFIMRGAYVPPGTHAVEFTFSLPLRAFYISVIGLSVTAVLGLFVFLATRRNEDTV